MKKTITKILPILLAIAMITTIAGCNKAPETPPASPPPTSQPPSPPQTPSPSPIPSTPSPSLAAPDVGLLELEEFYYLDGDPESDGCIFFADGAVSDTDGEFAEYKVVGDTVEVYLDSNLIISFLVVDGFTLQDINSGAQYIREGGEGYGFSSEGDPLSMPAVFYGEHYYLDGQEDGLSLYFWDDGSVEIGDAGSQALGTFEIEEDQIVVYVDGQPIGALNIMNYAELVDVYTGETYSLADTYIYSIVTDEPYFLIALGEMAGAFIFRDDGTAHILENLDTDEALEGAYTISDDTVSVEYEGEAMVLTIVNSYVLEYEGFNFVRIP